MRTMKENGLSVRPRPRFVATTDSNHDGPIFNDLARDARLSADITYIAIAYGFVYLAAALDAWSRRVVDYAIGRRIDARLALAALRAAVVSRAPPIGCISDRGCQYASEDYRAEHARHGLRCSMGDQPLQRCDPCFVGLDHVCRRRIFVECAASYFWTQMRIRLRARSWRFARFSASGLSQKLPFL